MLPRSLLFVLMILFVSVADAQGVKQPSRGEMLYANHCIACHDLKVHWRDKRLVRDWASLRQEVRRWQKVAVLGWSDEEIEAVAQYLNARYYHYPATY